jgi:hypothetical protein
MAAKPTNYKQTPDQRLVRPAYKPNPLTRIQITGQGTLSKPVPPMPVTSGYGLIPKLPAPGPADEPGASGSI